MSGNHPQLVSPIELFISPAARHALSRLPENLLVLPLSQALSSLLVTTINREYAKIYVEANNLLEFVAQSDFPDQELASIVTSLLTAFVGANSHRYFFQLF